jgi:hypothetical protein
MKREWAINHIYIKRLKKIHEREKLEWKPEQRDFKK